MVGLITGIVVIQINRNSQTVSENKEEESKPQSGEGVVEPITIGGDEGENGQEGEENKGNEDGEGNGEGQSIYSEPNDSEEARAQINEQVMIESAVKDYIRQLSIDEALEYLNTQIARYEDNINYKFSMQLIRINVLNNADRHEDALNEALAINNVDELSKWNKIEYYNMMAYTYKVLGNTEKEEEYGNLYIQAYKDLWGDFGGSK